MIKGQVKSFNRTKGYGYIRYENGKEVFVHYTAIRSNGFRSLIEGEKVNFELTDTSAGPMATNVVTLENDSNKINKMLCYDL